MRSARSLLLFAFCFLLFAFFINPQVAFAQTSNTYSTYSSDSTSSNNSFATPNVDPNVPQNQHTLAQSVTIEVLSAVMCQLTGIDPIDPSSPCLGINPQTGRLGYAPQQASSNTTLSAGEPQQIGGLVGVATNMIATTYRPSATESVYTQYLSDNFGIVKSANAAGASAPSCNNATGYGFCSLGPIFNLWLAVRNISYALLVFAFLFIGIGIMLRVKIDPRTVMTIQNQIPKVIIAIILITFSYAISALMVDLMWVSTYTGINIILSSNPDIANVNVGGGTIASKATTQILDLPIIYVNDVFHTSGSNSPTDAGISHITNKVSESISTIIGDITRSILGVSPGQGCFAPGKHKILGLYALPHFDMQACIADVFGWIANIVAELIIFITFIIALFKIWYNLIKAYVYTLFYIIISPIFIVMGLLPNKPLGFENWLRRFFANIAIFPITAFIFVVARILMDIYDNGAQDKFIPPLIGHNATSNFGAILAFGAILIAPNVQKILSEKIGVKQIGTPGIVAGGVAAGMSVVGAPAKKAMQHLNRYDQRSGDIGALAQMKRTVGEKGINALAGATGLKTFKRAAARRKLIEESGTVYGRDDAGNEVNRVDEVASKTRHDKVTNAKGEVVGKEGMGRRTRWTRRTSKKIQKQRAEAKQKAEDDSKKRLEAEAVAKVEAEARAKKGTP